MPSKARGRRQQQVALIQEPEHVMQTDEAWVPSGAPVYLQKCEAPDCFLVHRGGYAILGRVRVAVTITKKSGSPGPFMVDNDVVTISCNGKNLQGQSYTSYLCWAETKESSRSARFMLGGIGHGKRLSIFSGFTLRCIKWEGHQVGVYIEDPESAAADSETSRPS